MNSFSLSDEIGFLQQAYGAWFSASQIYASRDSELWKVATVQIDLDKVVNVWPAVFCKHASSATEMYGKYRLLKEGICEETELYNRYGHSIKGIYADLEDILEAGDLNAITGGLSKIPYLPHHGKEQKRQKNKNKDHRDYDKGSNWFTFKYSPGADDTEHKWPQVTVNEAFAEELVRSKTLPVLLRLIEEGFAECS